MTHAVTNGVRVGIFRDRPVFEACRDTYTSVVVPAHIAAYAGDGLWGFLTGIQQAGSSLNFWYDPMTYYVELGTEYWFRGSEENAGPRGTLPASDEKEIRPAFRELLRAYDLLETALTGTAADVRTRLISTGVARVLEFQRTGVSPKSKRAVSKYARILGLTLDDDSLRPSRVVAPYLAVTARDAHRQRNQELLNAASLAERRDGEPMWTVLALESKVAIGPLSSDEIARLHLDPFDGVGLWVSGLDEYTSSTQQLRDYRALVRSIGRPVWLIYAGFYWLLMSSDGVEAVSHGVYYTENKRIRSSVGSGPPAERYYIPRLHRFFEPARALRAISAVPSLACNCPECRSLDALRTELVLSPTSPDRRMAWISRLQRHFLRSRADEVAEVSTESLDVVLSRMTEARNEVRAAMRGDPEEAGRLTDHLATWAASFR
ncbi:MAG: hypothetical protein HY262_04365 [Chloroflexi bacterium]|nr:hypothetical protein [Chloroflexota bacterium]